MESRCLVADFDSTQQASIFDNFAEQDSIGRRLNSRLPAVISAARLGRIISDRLTIPSNQILDGCVLLDVGPEGFGRILGDDSQLSIVVLGSSDCLAGDLIDLVNNLRSFAFSTFHVFDLDELTLASHVPIGPAVSTVPEAIEVIRLAAHRAGDRVVSAVEWMVTKWLAWLDAEERGVLAHEQRQPFGDWLPNPPSHSLGIEANLVAALCAERTRSGALRLLRSTSMTPADLDRAWSWWNGEYLDAIAMLHDTFWLKCTSDLVDDGSFRSVAGNRDTDRQQSSLVLRGSALSYLQVMPGAVFAGIVFKTRLALCRWEEHASDRNLQVISHIVGRECEPIDIHRVRTELTIRIALTLVVAGVGALGSTVVGEDQRGWTAWVLIAVIAVLATLPFGDVKSRMNIRKRKVAAVIRRSNI